MQSPSSSSHLGANTGIFSADLDMGTPWTHFQCDSSLNRERRPHDFMEQPVAVQYILKHQMQAGIKVMVTGSLQILAPMEEFLVQ